MALWVFLTYDHYGFSTDEGSGYTRGQLLWEWYFGTGAPIEFSTVTRYGLLPDFLATVIEKLAPDIGIGGRHIVSALFGVAGMVYVYLVGSRFIDPVAGLVGLVLIAINPLWTGHMFFNMKDVPMASMVLATFYHCMRAYRAPAVRLSDWIGVTVAAGVLANIKIIGLAIAALLCLVAVAAYALARRERIPLDRLRLKRILLVSVAAGAGTVLFLLVFWPQLYSFNPRQLTAAIVKFANFDAWRGVALLNGKIYHAGAVPRSYLLTYWAVSLPLLALALALFAPVAFALRPHPVPAALGFFVVFVLAYQFVSRATVYDGYRHFLFLLPPFLLVCAFTVSTALRRLSPVAGTALGAALVVCAGMNAGFAWRLEPFQYSYYNTLVGGLKGAAGRFSIDTWRTGPYAPLKALAAQAGANGTRPTVADCSTPLNRLVFPQLAFTGRREAEYLVTSYGRCDTPRWTGRFPQVLVRVERDGVVISELRRAAPQAQ